MTEPQTQNLPYLDGWRGMAIIAVLVAHFTPNNVTPTWLGDLGVALFFVLSGYLMANLLFIKKVRLSDFFARRFSRVFPTFWLFVAAMLAYAALLQPNPHLVSAVDFFSTIFFMRSYLPSDVSIWAGQWPIGHIWFERRGA